MVIQFLIQIYTDIIRRNVEQFGAKSEQALEALKDVDDILQAKLTDIKAKNQNADLVNRVQDLETVVLTQKEFLERLTGVKF